MSFFFQELVNGVTTGALYALVALGFSMVYGVLKLLNFAHGDLYMVGAYIGFFVIQWFGGAQHLTIAVPLLLVIMFVLAAGLVGGLGVAIERFAYRPLRDSPRIAAHYTPAGVSMFLESWDRLDTGSDARRPADRPGGVVRHRLHLLHLQQPDRVRNPDRRDAAAAQRAARPGAVAEGLRRPMSIDPQGPEVGVDEWVARQAH